MARCADPRARDRGTHVAMRNLLCLAVALAACGNNTKSAPESHRPSDTGAVGEEQFKAMPRPPGGGPQDLKGTQVHLGGPKAYLGLPAGKGPFPGIVLIHEWWGLNGHIEHYADRLAAIGWAALAVDLYSGTIATNRDEAMAAMKAVDESKAAATISAAIDFLGKDPRIAAPKRAIIGWCFGGGRRLRTALAHPELDGAVIYYGQLETDPAKLGAIKAHVLGVFGNQDKGIPPPTVDKFEAGLKEAHVDAQIF